MACPAIRPHFFGACPKKRCRAAKEKRFEASTSPWWARPPLPFGRKPQRDRSVRQVGLYIVGRPGTQVSLTQSAVMLGLRVRGRGGRDRTPPVAAPISAFLWGSTPFLCARAKKWGGTGRASAVYCPIKRRTRTNPRQPPIPSPSRARNVPSTDRQRSRGWWSHRGKKGAFLWRLDTVSLGKHQRNGVESQDKVKTPAQRIGAHAESKEKGEPPARVPP